MPTIGKPKVNFKVLDSNDPQVLLVGDFSNWLFLRNKPSVISITLPGASQPIEYSFVKGTINMYDSKSLYNTCSECDYSDLNDGVYKITLRSSPDTFFHEAYYLKTDVIELQIAKRLVDIGFQYNETNESKYREINKIKDYLNGAKARVQLGYISEGIKFFDEAKKLINKCNNC